MPQGRKVVGVHSPEFEFGKKRINIERAVKRFHIHYPVAMDSHMATWNAWHNRYWPAEYLIDRQGNVVLHHFGEGHYLDMENAIRTQLGLPPTEHAVTPGPDFTAIGSPEMYFGLEAVVPDPVIPTGARSAERRNLVIPSQCSPDWPVPPSAPPC